MVPASREPTSYRWANALTSGLANQPFRQFMRKSQHRPVGDDRATVVRGNAADFVRTPARQMNFIFLDPPYDDAEAYSHALHAIAAGNALVTGGIIIAEHAATKSRKNGFALADKYGELKRVRLLEQGDAALSFYSF